MSIITERFITFQVNITFRVPGYLEHSFDTREWRLFSAQCLHELLHKSGFPVDEEVEQAVVYACVLSLLFFFNN